MDTLLARLRVALQLDSAAFESGAKRAAAEVNTFGSKAEQAGFKIGTMGKAIAGGIAAFAGTAVVQQLKDMVVGALDYASGLSEAAQQMGVTVEALQQFRLLAAQSGVEQETMDKALQKLTRSMGEAAAGGKKQATAFDELGISIRDSNGHMKTADQLLPEIAGALEKVASPAERAKYEVALFGKAGQDLEPLLGQGEQAIRDFMKQAQDAGIIISKDLADKSDAAADKIEFLKTKLEMKWNVKVAEHAGEIEAIVDKIDQLVDRLFRLIDLLGRFANSPGGRLLAKINDVASLANPLGAAGKLGGMALDGMDQKPSGGGGAVTPAKPTTWQGSTQGGSMKSGGTYSAGKGPLAGYAGGGSFMPSAAGDFAGMQPGNRAPMFETLLYLPEQMQEAMSKVTDATAEMSDKVDVANVRINQSFKDMAQATISSLQNLANAVQGGGFLNILSSVLNLGLQLGSIGAFGKSIQGNINSMPKYADGTSFHPGGLAMVGERGPELVNLPRGSRVWPHGQGPGGGGGNVYNFTGNLMTPEFFEGIQRGNVAAAQAGGELGYRKVVRAGSRRLGA
ncbi:hypothetical protein [Novosphingobium sp.]|uniref:hypothetical protein n=1 Tax=Novosphingobium sp. TaxID=1874826 RepID=UPI0038BB232E